MGTGSGAFFNSGKRRERPVNGLDPQEFRGKREISKEAEHPQAPRSVKMKSQGSAPVRPAPKRSSWGWESAAETPKSDAECKSNPIRLKGEDVLDLTARPFLPCRSRF
jgi:hypothetical protein